MAINITVPLEALDSERVATALANLVLAPGKVETETVVDKSKKTRRRAAPKPVPLDDGRSADERWEDFYGALPDRSQKFLDLVKAKGELTISEAMSQLDVDIPKAMGGITGSIGRWAPVKGVEVPYEAAFDSKGERVWRWTQAEDSNAKKAKGRARKEQTAASSDNTSDEPEVIAQLTDGMRELAKDFLTRLWREREISISNIMKEFGLAAPSAVNGLLEPIEQRSGEIGLPLPYEATTTTTGERAWRWRTNQAKPGNRQARQPGVRLRRRRPERSAS
ncbi:MAG: hypothetical protein KC561_09035 [Myxococcales bacterium]|nr:hypothetical protein [Myxococcales bacterium]